MCKGLKRKSAPIQYQALRRVQYNTYHCVFLLFNSFPDHIRSFGNSMDTCWPTQTPAHGDHLMRQDPSQSLGCSYHPAVLFLSPATCKGCCNSVWYQQVSKEWNLQWRSQHRLLTNTNFQRSGASKQAMTTHWKPFQYIHWFTLKVHCNRWECTLKITQQTTKQNRSPETLRGLSSKRWS